jgi:hypothetical protein
MDDKNFRKAVKHGFLAGIASSSSIFSYPLEVLKIRSHVVEDKFFLKNIVVNMYKSEGVKSFYKGLFQNLLHGFLGYGIVFMTHEVLMNKLNFFNPNSFLINSLISSTIAGITAVTLTSPINYIKTRQILYITHGSIKKSSFIIIKEIYRENKTFKAFWKALNPSMITSFYSAIQICLYTSLKRRFLLNNENLKLNSILGLVSRCIACVMIFPFALLRSRMLNLPKKSVGEKEMFYTSNYEYRRTLHDCFSIIRREGFLSLFRGLKYELIKVAINGALFFYFYEFLNKKYNSLD